MTLETFLIIGMAILSAMNVVQGVWLKRAGRETRDLDKQLEDSERRLTQMSKLLDDQLFEDLWTSTNEP